MPHPSCPPSSLLILLSPFILSLSTLFPHATATYRFPTSPPSRVAICLVGGLRFFELTGPSIKNNLIPLYPNADIFVVTPRDENAWKIYLLEGTNVVAAKIAEQTDISVDNVTEFVVPRAASPTGRQGLLKYLELLESMKNLVEEYERENGFVYDWILRTRPDGLWEKSLAIEGHNREKHFSRESFYIPPGSDWKGINDRFTLGNRDWSLASLAGISSIPLHYKQKQKEMTSEVKFQRLLRNNNISSQIVRAHVPFCVLTKRTFNYPPTSLYDGKVAPLGSPSARDGVYCWPCVAENDPKILIQIPKLDPNIDDYCDVRHQTTWPSNWIELFKKAVGEKEFEEYLKFKSEFGQKSCLKNVHRFIKSIKLQKGGFSPSSLCHISVFSLT